ncbi:MAG: hypothetical protein DRG78_06530 [Epsilonproteobacteria bacterium]|nr:MAG: hypothetical protein DRG78_06530 [Campylobacterota bacterium]
MKNIQDKATQRYLKNQDFFAQYHPHVLKKIESFQDDLASGLRQEKYSLEYKNGYFDVLEISSQNFLYNTNSVEFSHKLSSVINYSKSSFIFDGFAMFKDYEQHKDEFDDKLKGLEGIYPIMSYYLHNSPPEPQMQEIEKFIFIGLGLALHLLPTDEKIKAVEYFLIEDDIELFNLSLFTTPYYKLNAKLTFSINENQELFTQNFSNFLTMSFFRNKYLKYLYFSAHSDEKIKLIKNVLSSQVFASFPYKTLLQKYTRPLQYMKMDYKFINFSEHFKLSNISNKPLLILAAGPSFTKNITWLENNHQHFVILAVSAVLNKLQEKNITPDIVTHLDGFEISKEHFKGFETQKFLKNSILIAGSFTPMEVLEKFSKKNVYIMEELSTNYHDGYDSFTGPCVGSTSVFQAIHMNFQNIYTLGIDLAVDNEGNSHASSHTITNNQYNKETLNKLQNNISFRGDFFKVKGNFLKDVYTNPLFYSSLQSLNLSIGLLKETTQSLYNMSNGAYISHMLPTNIQTIQPQETLDKKELHNELVVFLDKYSTTVLTNEDLISLEKRLKFADEIRKKLTLYKQQILPIHKEQYLHNLISLILEILIEPNRERNSLITLYDYFFSYAIPIIFDFFNTKNLKNSKRHIENFDKLLLDEMFDICEIYKVRLEDFLKKSL